MYWRGIGYLEDAACCFKIFEHKPLRACRSWNGFYNSLARSESLRLLHD
jgi:hypothetical protein